MNDLIRSIIAEIAGHTGASDAYTLVGGRIFRTQAPSQIIGKDDYYIVITLAGGAIERTFSRRNIEDHRIQVSVFGPLTHDYATGGVIWKSLTDILDNAAPFALDGETTMVMRREGLPREMVDGERIHINGDWILERLT